jgi:LacI family transcriptional regulator
LGHVQGPIRVILINFMHTLGARDLLRGIRDYCLQSPLSWRLNPALGHAAAPIESWLERAIMNWRPDAFVVNLGHGRVPGMVAAMGLPAVCLSSDTDSGLPQVIKDNKTIGRLAAEHLLDRGLRHFAYVARTGTSYSEQRYEGFAARLAESGFTAPAIEFDLRQQGELDASSYIDREGELTLWLKGLPTPVGIMATHDYLAHQVIFACGEIGLSVPGRVAVVGVDNTEQLCTGWTPTITSVDPGGARQGFEAMRLLERLIQGEAPPSAPIIVPPQGVVARESSDLIGIGDEVVSVAAQWVRENATRPIDVGDVVAQVGLSRRALERRFKTALGHTLHDEISRVRLECAKALLVDTALPISDIARRSGYAFHINFSSFFKRATGQSPLEYRKAHCVR